MDYFFIMNIFQVLILQGKNFKKVSIAALEKDKFFLFSIDLSRNTINIVYYFFLEFPIMIEPNVLPNCCFIFALACGVIILSSQLGLTI